MPRLVDRAKKAASYCWHLNKKKDDEESLHKFLDVSYDTYVSWMVKEKFMNGQQKVTARLAERLSVSKG